MLIFPFIPKLFSFFFNLEFAGHVNFFCSLLDGTLVVIEPSLLSSFAVMPGPVSSYLQKSLKRSEMEKDIVDVHTHDSLAIRSGKSSYY